jgi:anti-sigma factor RsiW
MRQPSDETLIAYLDGELDTEAREEIAAALEQDAALRDRAGALTETAQILRSALDDVLREEVPQRLIDAAKGTEHRSGGGHRGVIDLMAARARRVGSLPPSWNTRRVWTGAAIAASLCLVIGAGGGYFAGQGPVQPQREVADNSGLSYFDNIAGYHRLLINAGVNEQGLVDVPANGDQGRKNIQKLPANFHLPNLKNFGLTFDGARYLIVEGQPATQLFYTSQDKKLGSITMVVGATGKPDMPIAAERRDDVNFVYWRHRGHAYAVVGSAEPAALRNIAKQIYAQLNAAT